MSSKLRRTPLFGYDGNLGIPIIPPSNSTNKTNKNSSSTHSATSTKFGFDYNKSKVNQWYCTYEFYFISVS